MPGGLYLPSVDFPPPSPAVGDIAPRDTLDRVATAPSKQQVQASAAWAVARVLYGRGRLGADLYDFGVLGGDLVLWLVWGYGPWDGIESITLGDAALPAGVTVAHYTGAQTTHDPTLALLYNASAAQKAAMVYPNLVYSVARVPPGTTSGFPTFAAIWRGRKLYDPRNPAHDPDDPSTWTYSDNATLATADYYRSSVYGLGRTVIWGGVTDCADRNDALIAAAKRSRINLALDSRQAAAHWAAALCEYAEVWALDDGAEVAFVPDAPVDPVMDFAHDAGQIVELAPLEFSRLADAPNVVEIVWTDASQIPWREAVATAIADGVAEGSVDVRLSRVPLLGIHDGSQAARAAIQRLNKTKLCDLATRLRAPDRAAPIEIGDVVRVTHPAGLTLKPFRVTAKSGEMGDYWLTLKEYDAASYSNAVVDASTTPDTLLPDPSTPPAPPTNLIITERNYIARDGTVATRFELAWDAPIDEFYPYWYYVAVINQVSGEVVWSGNIADTAWMTGALAEDVSYDVAIQTERRANRRRSALLSETKTARGKLIKPSNVPYASASIDASGVVLSYGEAVDVDLRGYVAQHGAWVDSAQAVASAAQGVLAMALGFVEPGDHLWSIKAADRSGNVSDAAATASLVIYAPARPIVATSLDGEYVALSWGAADASYPMDRYEVRQGESFESSVLVATAYSLSARFRAAGGGSQKYWVSGIDRGGNMGLSGMAEVYISPPAAPAVTVEVIDNNILLRWTIAASSLPLAHAEMRKGVAWETGEQIGWVKGGFATIFESFAGEYRYWIAGVDVAGNVGSPTPVTARVSQPPDFQLLYDQDSAFAGTLTNCVLEDGRLLVLANAAETFDQHFTSHSWASPQDQIDAGYPHYIQPAQASGSYEEIIDYGVTVASTSIGVISEAIVANNEVSESCTISVSNTSSAGPWVDYVGLYNIYATAFRWVKVKLTWTRNVATARPVYVDRINIKLSFKLQTDAGTAYCNASDVGGTTISFNRLFVDVVSPPTVTPLRNLVDEPLAAVVDFTDVPYPASFKIALYNSTTGVRRSGPVSWACKGVV